jgi:hypothetical protein
MSVKRLLLVVLLVAGVAIHFHYVPDLGWLTDVIFAIITLGYLGFLLVTEKKVGLDHLMILPLVYLGVAPFIESYAADKYEDEIRLVSWKFHPKESWAGTLDVTLENKGNRDIDYLEYQITLTSISSEYKIVESGFIIDFHSDTRKTETIILTEADFEPSDIEFNTESIKFK